MCTVEQCQRHGETIVLVPLPPSHKQRHRLLTQLLAVPSSCSISKRTRVTCSRLFDCKCFRMSQQSRLSWSVQAHMWHRDSRKCCSAADTNVQAGVGNSGDLTLLALQLPGPSPPQVGRSVSMSALLTDAVRYAVTAAISAALPCTL